MSFVSEIAPAPAADVEERYSRRLMFETDCWDVNESKRTRTADFVLLDVRSPKQY
jgi:hypothetical protein